MKVVHIESGLGNQMLSYCEYLALKKVNPKEKIYIETIIYEIPEAAEYISQWNGYELDKIFNIKAPNIKELYSEDEWKKIVEEVKETEFWKKNWNYPVYITSVLNNHGMNLENIRGNFEKNWELIVPKNKKWPLWFKLKQLPVYSNLRKLYYRYYKDKKYINDQDILFYNKSNDIFTGQRLTFKNKDNNIELIENEIKEAFTFPLDKNEQNLLLKTELQNYNSVAIHARRGDMLSYNGKHYKDGYFKRAVKYIKNNVDNPVFYFFCDPGSVEWCKKNAKVFNLDFKKDKVKFIDWNKGTESFRDMELMSYCKYNIITYSSFGWWGAYFNNYKNKITISPESFINTTNNF